MLVISAHRICVLMEKGLTDIEVADKLTVNVNKVSEIRRGKTFSRISSGYSIRKPRRRLKEEEAHAICAKLVRGVPVETLSDEFDVSPSMIRSIKYGAYWKDVVKLYNIPIKQIRARQANECMDSP